MKAKMCLCLCLLLPLFFAAFFTDTARGDVISERLAKCLTDYIANPYPRQSDWGDPDIAVIGKAGRAMAVLYMNTDNTSITAANVDVNDLCAYSIPQTGISFMTAFELPILCRIYLDPTCNSHLCPAAKRNIANTMHAFVDYRSKCSDANASVWRVAGSENWDVTLKTTFLLGCQVLKNYTASYGPNHVLQDGHTVNAHIAAWQAYFFEYFRQRAREGLNCEIASQTYAKYTLSGIYNVCDYAESSDLRSFAGTFINLFWADYAADLVPFNGVRGGAETRWYQNNIGDETDSLSDITYAYNWHDNVPTGIYPNELMIFLSSYRNPAWLDNLAGNPNRTAYTSTTRRFGRGTCVVDPNFNYMYTAKWADPCNSSNIRRDTYWHKDYVIGGLSLKTSNPPSNDYWDVFNQNRTMGIIYDVNGLSDRIIIDGNGTSHGNTAGFNELAGVCGKNCLIVARDPNACQSTGTRIFLPYGNIFKKIDPDSSWYFTQTGPYGCVGRKYIADVCSVCIRNELLDGNNSTNWQPSHNPSRDNTNPVSGQGYYLKFDYTQKQVAYATQGWQSYDSVKADFYFKPASTAATTRVIMCAPSIWEITVSNRTLNFQRYNQTGGSYYTQTLSNAFQIGKWSHVVATVAVNGAMTLTADNTADGGTDNNSVGPYSDGYTLKLQSTSIVLGNKTNTTRFFDGNIDVVRISVPSGRCIAAWDMESDYVKDVYTAFRIANGGYNQRPDPNCGGYRWVLADKFSPVVFEVNSAALTTYANFKDAVKNHTTWTWDSGNKILTYKSCNGNTYVYREQSGTLPTINGTPISLNPSKAYNCPYVDGDHGMDFVTIKNGLGDSNTLNFNFATKSRLWDDYQTVALWHMENLGFYYVWFVMDDCLENPTRGNTLRLYNRANGNTVAGPTTSFANAVAFAGTQYADGNNPWPPYKTVKVDLWFKASSTTGTQVLATAANIWNLQLAGSSVEFDMWDTGNTAHPVTVSSCVSLNWQHATATVDASGNMKLVVDNFTPATSTSTGYTMKTTTPTTITLCNKPGTTRYFQGSLDDVKISRYSTP